MKKYLIAGLFISALTAVVATRLNARPVTPCVWPNPCETHSFTQIETCVWPHKCVIAM